MIVEDKIKRVSVIVEDNIKRVSVIVEDKIGHLPSCAKKLL